LPQIDNRVDLDPALTDLHAKPVARITYRSHGFELAASAFYAPIMLDVLKAAGAVFVAPLGGDSPKGVLPPDFESNFQNPALALVPGSRHIMGTLRMGTHPSSADPEYDYSVTDPRGKFHDVDNLYAADGSLFPTSGGMNPSLTIMALGYRVGCCIVNPDEPLAVARAIDPKTGLNI
jgi:choline dehydrogenase-like flavoprotein